MRTTEARSWGEKREREKVEVKGGIVDSFPTTFLPPPSSLRASVVFFD